MLDTFGTGFAKCQSAAHLTVDMDDMTTHLLHEQVHAPVDGHRLSVGFPHARLEWHN